MTMYAVGIEQVIPYAGKLDVQRQIAERERDAAEASVVAAERQLIRDLKDAFYEVTFDDRALAIIRRNADVVGALVGATQERYSVGRAEQQDVLRARVEATRLAETASVLTEQRRGALARLNALLDQPSETPLAAPAIPSSLEREAGAAGTSATFLSATLGARASGSPIPPVETLQDLAIRANPELRAHEAMIAAQAARVDLARKAALPDFHVSLQYGYRTGGLPGMVSAAVSVPVPVHRRERQGQGVAAADAELEALHAEHVAKVNAIRSEVARLVADLERSRAQLALHARALAPQARATLTASTASYETGRAEFATVVDGQTALFAIEMESARALTDFAKNMAALEQVVGQEMLR
jgi:outer membrane protein TolC